MEMECSYLTQDDSKRDSDLAFGWQNPKTLIYSNIKRVHFEKVPQMKKLG